MDVQFWIYVVIGVIYFLSRVLKKPEQGPAETNAPERQERANPRPGQRQARQPEAETPKPLTFEELLREITEGKQSPKPAPEPVVVPRYEEYEKDRGDEARSLEEISYDESDRVSRWKPYEEVPVQTERRSLEETLKLEDTVVDYGKFAAFEQRTKKKLLEDYIKIMRNPETLKQAVVMSEILKRKF